MGKLRSMHLAMPGTVTHLYHTYRALSQEGGDRPGFHIEIGDWKALVEQTWARPTHAADIICQEPICLGFCDASGIGTGGV